MTASDWIMYGDDTWMKKKSVLVNDRKIRCRASGCNNIFVVINVNEWVCLRVMRMSDFMNEENNRKKIAFLSLASDMIWAHFHLHTRNPLAWRTSIYATPTGVEIRDHLWKPCVIFLFVVIYDAIDFPPGALDRIKNGYSGGGATHYTHSYSYSRWSIKSVLKEIIGVSIVVFE